MPFNFLDKTSVDFQDLHKTLDSIFNELHTSGIGADTKSSIVISYDHEDLLWRHGALTPVVCFMLYFLCWLVVLSLRRSGTEGVSVGQFQAHS